MRWTLRASIWQTTIGNCYFEIAFEEAHKIDPSAELVYTDFNIETVNAKSNAVFVRWCRVFKEGDTDQYHRHPG